MTTLISQKVSAALDTAIAGSLLNAIASAGYAMGAAIDNRPTDGSVVSYDLADLTITFSSPVTTGATPPYIMVFILPAVDGVNYPTPPGASGAAAPWYLGKTFPMLASTSTTTIICPDIPIPPYLFKIMIQNVLGAAFPTGTANTCQLQRKSIAYW